MNAQQKARELINRFNYLDEKKAKEYALVLVNEIIESRPLFPSNVDWDEVGATHKDYFEAQLEEAENFWLAVKKEIQNY